MIRTRVLTVLSGGLVAVACACGSTTVSPIGSPVCTTGADGGALVWSKTFSITPSYHYMGDVSCLAVDAEGDIVIAGTDIPYLHFGCTSLGAPGPGGGNLFVTMLAPDGTCLWSRNAGASTNGDVFGVAVDGSGDVVLTGSFEGSIDFGDGPLTSKSSSAMFVVKLDAHGAPVWSRLFGGNDEIGTSIALDAQGNAVVTGYVNTSIEVGTHLLTIPGSVPLGTLVAKLDPSGEPLWSEVFGGAVANAVAIDASGNALVAAYLLEGGTADLGCGPIEGAVFDGFLAKLDPDGACVWATPLGKALPTAVAVDGDGAAFVTANLGASGPDTAPNEDSVVLKITADGTMAWNLFVTSAFTLTSVAVGASGNVFVTGGGFMDPPTPAPRSARDALGADASGTGNVFAASVDTAGNERWAVRFGDLRSQGGRAIAVDPACHVVIGGHGLETGDIEPFVAALTP